MPELPDVEIFRRRLERATEGRSIAAVEVRDGRLLKGVSARDLARRLTDRRLLSTRRHGKHLLAEIEGGGWLALHFGMTGELKELAAAADDPPYTRLRLALSDGSGLAVCDRRRLGHLAIADTAEDYGEAEGLGPDALDELSEGQFRRLLADSRASLKALLMDQGKLAGVGNLYSDEILFQAKLDPERPAKDLSSPESKRLYKTLQDVLRVAVEREAGSETFLERLPKGFLLPHREEGAACPRCGRALVRRKAGGRSAYHCPHCQQ